jgi:hypothetical protein
MKAALDMVKKEILDRKILPEHLQKSLSALFRKVG